MDFFGEFKDLWKMRGTYWFYKNWTAKPQKPLICLLSIKIGKQMAEKDFMGKNWDSVPVCNVLI